MTVYEIRVLAGGPPAGAATDQVTVRVDTRTGDVRASGPGARAAKAIDRGALLAALDPAAHSTR